MLQQPHQGKTRLQGDAEADDADGKEHHFVAERGHPLGSAQDHRDTLADTDGGAGAGRHHEHKIGARHIGQEEQCTERRAVAELVPAAKEVLDRADQWATAHDLEPISRVMFAPSIPNDVFWVHVQAIGAWDVALVTDPKAALRQKGLNRDLYLYGVPVSLNNGQPVNGTAVIKPATSTVVRTTPGDGITYLGFADFHGDPNNPGAYKPFFPTYYDRITVFNGVETGTINHSIGMRYCTAGSNNEHFPCFASQVACVRAPSARSRS